MLRSYRVIRHDSPLDHDSRKFRGGSASFSMYNNRASIILKVSGETQRRVGTAKSKTVRDGNINTPLLRDFGDIVAIELVARVPWMF